MLLPWIQLVVVDMNNLSPRSILVAIAVVMEAAPHPPFNTPWSWLAQGGPFCQNDPFGLTNEVLKQRDTINQMMFVLTGYFIYDFFDMVFNQKLSQSWELLFHHTVVGLPHKNKFIQGTALSVMFQTLLYGETSFFTFIFKCCPLLQL